LQPTFAGIKCPFPGVNKKLQKLEVLQGHQFDRLALSASPVDRQTRPNKGVLDSGLYRKAHPKFRPVQTLQRRLLGYDLAVV
jgi:hypothetical protein